MDAYLGEIRMFSGTFAPAGWQMCNGQLLPISQYTALFSIVGTTYGGNGTQTFSLPDLRGRVPVHQGQGIGTGNYVLGENGGTESVTLTTTQMPAHTHLVNVDGTGNGQVTPQGNLLGPLGRSAPEKFYSNGTANATMSPTMIGAAGGSQPVSIL
jgi:microcystin-dependent protein